MRGYNAIAGNVVPETVANVNLRDLGASRTLVLLNGRRQTYVPARLIGGRFVDVNAFPSIIDRIEVLKEGASAIYGSDAVAGVANFVTRDEFAGFEVTGSYDHFAHAGDSNLGAIWGGALGNGAVRNSKPRSETGRCARILALRRHPFGRAGQSGAAGVLRDLLGGGGV